jgi:hypothetical protein
MSVITATNVYQESFGSLKAHIATFATNASSGDYWASSIPNIMCAFVCNGYSLGTTGTNISCLFTGSDVYFSGVQATMGPISCVVLSKSG